MRFPIFILTVLILSMGILGISAPPFLSRFELHPYPFFAYPHWSAYVAFSFVLGAALLCRTRSEQRGILLLSIILSVVTAYICWDVTEFNVFFAWTRWYGLVLATPALFVLLHRRIFRSRQVGHIEFPDRKRD